MPQHVTAEMLAVINRMYDQEATDAEVYQRMAERARTAHNKEIIERIAKDEVRHRETWGAFVDRAPKVNAFTVWFFTLLSRIFGVVFTINLMEKAEIDAAAVYKKLGKDVPVALELMADEERHEEYLVSLIEEEKLSYISSIVLGLNDALVELTGALAGFTLALGDNTLIGLAGFITGVAATLSMAASEYLSKKADPGEKHPFKASVYTGVAYLFTVAFLLLPYAIFSSPFMALGLCLFNAGLIILGFTYFVSIVRRTSFLKGFREMILISASVAAISFFIGWAAKLWLGVDF